MNNGIVLGLINNTALLLALFVVYELRHFFSNKLCKYINYINGVFLGLIAIAIMTVPLRLSDGIVFDTRTILISVAALIFGTVPTIIASLMASIYRIVMGGAGVYTGVLTILSAAIIGILWRHFIQKRDTKIKWLKTYLMGLIVHIVMLLCMFSLPADTALAVLKTISAPVLIIFPIATVLLVLLLQSQKQRNDSMILAAKATSRYKSMFNNNHAVMLIIEPKTGEIIDANPAACDFYGYSIEKIKKMKIFDINTLPSGEIKNKLHQSIEKNMKSFQFKHRKATGDIVDVEVFSGPIEIDDKKYLYSIVHDITPRVLYEKALKESEVKFRGVVEGAPDAIFIKLEGKFAFLNEKALDLFGAKSAQELIGMDVFDRFHPDFHDEIKRRINTLNKIRKAVSPLEEVYLKVDGTPVPVDVTAVPINHEGKNGAIVFARDISERKALEESKSEIEAQLRQQQKLEAIGTLAGGVAHEINNPINGIMNYAQLLLDMNKENTDQTEYANAILDETKRVSSIVRDLLQFSRQEKQSHSYADVYDIINRTISLIKTVIKKDQINLEVNIQEELPQMKCRSQQIQQVLMNLLTNSRDALNEKYSGFNENKKIVVSCNMYHNDDRRWICICVKDFGMGIKEEDFDKIFTPFYSTKPKDKGTGLGLSISFGIVADHHGHIEVDSKYGEYTSINVHLPVDNGWDI